MAITWSALPITHGDAYRFQATAEQSLIDMVPGLRQLIRDIATRIIASDDAVAAAQSLGSCLNYCVTGIATYARLFPSFQVIVSPTVRHDVPALSVAVDSRSSPFGNSRAMRLSAARSHSLHVVVSHSHSWDRLAQPLQGAIQTGLCSLGAGESRPLLDTTRASGEWWGEAGDVSPPATPITANGRSWGWLEPLRGHVAGIQPAEASAVLALRAVEILARDESHQARVHQVSLEASTGERIAARRWQAVDPKGALMCEALEPGRAGVLPGRMSLSKRRWLRWQEVTCDPFARGNVIARVRLPDPICLGDF